MGVRLEKIEHFEHWWKDKLEPWKNLSFSRKWRKKQMNKFIRRQNIDSDDIGGKVGRKPYKGYEY